MLEGYVAQRGLRCELCKSNCFFAERNSVYPAVIVSLTPKEDVAVWLVLGREGSSLFTTAEAAESPRRANQRLSEAVYMLEGAEILVHCWRRGHDGKMWDEKAQSRIFQM